MSRELSSLAGPKGSALGGGSGAKPLNTEAPARVDRSFSRFCCRDQARYPVPLLVGSVDPAATIIHLPFDAARV